MFQVSLSTSVLSTSVFNYTDLNSTFDFLAKSIQAFEVLQLPVT